MVSVFQQSRAEINKLDKEIGIYSSHIFKEGVFLLFLLVVQLNLEFHERGSPLHWVAPSNFVDSGKIGGTVKDSGLGFN